MPPNLLTTTLLGLQYPSAANNGANFAAGIATLAEDLDVHLATFAPADVVTALPGSPEEGQIVLFQSAAMAALGAVWQLRYRSGASGSYKWEFAGGAALLDRSASGASGITPGGSYAAPSDADGPSLTAPLAGVYTLGYGMTVDTDPLANSAASMAPKVGAATPADVDACRVVGGIPPGGSSAWGGTVARHKDITAAAADVVQAHYKASGGVVVWERWMTLVPVKVG